MQKRPQKNPSKNLVSCLALLPFFSLLSPPRLTLYRTRSGFFRTKASQPE